MEALSYNSWIIHDNSLHLHFWLERIEIGRTPLFLLFAQKFSGNFPCLEVDTPKKHPKTRLDLPALLPVVKMGVPPGGRADLPH